MLLRMPSCLDVPRLFDGLQSDRLVVASDELRLSVQLVPAYGDTRFPSRGGPHDLSTNRAIPRCWGAPFEAVVDPCTSARQTW